MSTARATPAPTLYAADDTHPDLTFSRAVRFEGAMSNRLGLSMPEGGRASFTTIAMIDANKHPVFHSANQERFRHVDDILRCAPLHAIPEDSLTELRSSLTQALAARQSSLERANTTREKTIALMLQHQSTEQDLLAEVQTCYARAVVELSSTEWEVARRPGNRHTKMLRAAIRQFDLARKASLLATISRRQIETCSTLLIQNSNEQVAAANFFADSICEEMVVALGKSAQLNTCTC